MKQTYEQQIESLTKDISEHEANPVLAKYGQELGIAELVRDGRTFRIFAKEVQKAKSGKAVLVELKAFVQKDGEHFALVRGHTYLPNFVLENKDVYWILTNKIYGKTGDVEDLGIESQYIPKEFNIRGNFWSQDNHESPEDYANSFIKFLKSFKVRIMKDHRIEVNTLAFMEKLS